MPGLLSCKTIDNTLCYMKCTSVRDARSLTGTGKVFLDVWNIALLHRVPTDPPLHDPYYTFSSQTWTRR